MRHALPSLRSNAERRSSTSKSRPPSRAASRASTSGSSITVPTLSHGTCRELNVVVLATSSFHVIYLCVPVVDHSITYVAITRRCDPPRKQGHKLAKRLDAHR